MTNESPDVSRRGALLGAATLGIVAALPAHAAVGSGLSATISASDTAHPISPFIYGGFLEHIGDLINHSLWSEVLDDRKFYWPVDSQPIPAPPSQGGRPPRTSSNKWRPTGPDASVTMDKSAPYVGKQSPVVRVDGGGAFGVTQSELIVARQAYTGRVVIAADSGVAVSATLIWGDGASARQTIAVPASQGWSTAPLRFDCGADTKNARLEITGTGTGTFRIGAVSLMPANNVGGFRADMIALMREMDCHLLRVPGGNFISAYDWQYTVGDPDKRAPIMDPVWHAVQPNDVGVDELLHMAQLIDAEPYWCISTGFDEPRSGAQILEYVNGAATTEWGAKRAANGHPEPWHVKYWDVGNEMYGHWQTGHMDRDQYYVKHNLFVDAMRAVDPTIYICAPGGFADEMTTGQGIFIAGQPKVEIGSDRDWAYGMFENCMGRFDALQTHAYPAENKHYDLATGKLVDIQQDLNEWSRGMAQRIQTMADCWGRLQDALPRAQPRQGQGVFRRVGLSRPLGLQGVAGGGYGAARILSPHRLHRCSGLYHGYRLEWISTAPPRSSAPRAGRSSSTTNISGSSRSRSPAIRRCRRRNTPSAATSPASIPAAPPGRLMSRPR